MLKKDFGANRILGLRKGYAYNKKKISKSSVPLEKYIYTVQFIRFYWVF